MPLHKLSENLVVIPSPNWPFGSGTIWIEIPSHQKHRCLLKKRTSTKLMHPKAQTCASCILTISRAIRIYQKQTENHQNDLTSYPLKHQHFPHFGHLVVISPTVGQPLTSWGVSSCGLTTESTESLQIGVGSNCWASSFPRRSSTPSREAELPKKTV